MSIRSYDISYLEQVSTNLGAMFQYAAILEKDPIKFWNTFISSDIAKEIENGNPKYLVGYSGYELYYFVSKNEEEYDSLEIYSRTKYFWAAWAIAQYQNYRAISFYNINKIMTIENILMMYDSLHEADITKFFDILDEINLQNRNMTNLKKIRLYSGLSQRELAVKSEVSIRNIQMYEQRNNDINKAQTDILFRISKTLGCRIEDLFEQ